MSTQLPNTNFNKAEETLNKLKSDYKLSKKQDDLNVDLGELRQLTFDTFSIDFEKIGDILAKNIQQLSKDVLKIKITDIQNLFPDEQHQQSVERWFKYGKDVLEKIIEHKGNNCPICNTDISDRLDLLLQDYQNYFDENYEIFISELKTKTDEASAVITLLDQYEINTEKLDKLFTKYKIYLDDLLLEKYNFSAIKNDFTLLKKALIAKNDNIQNVLNKPSSISDNFVKLNEAITKFQNLKTSILSVLESKKLDTPTIERNIRQTYNDIIVLEFNNSDKTGALKKYKNNKNRISIIEDSKSEGLPFLKDKLRKELKKLKTESKSISTYLIKMGIDHFDIDINENEQDENIIIKYKNSTNNKNKLKNCLSDGEKTALAFAYFLSKFENEINTSEKVKDSVVVIDDPISSLDDNRLYSTAHLIWRNFEEVKQLIVLSHNFLFLKFFNSFYCGKANCLFLEGEQIIDLPDELKNFETPYFYMLKTIFDFLNQNNQNVTYNEAKRYLPNFIRRVLETFLSFKFSRTVNKSGGYRSPGLNEFDENIDNTNMEDKIKKELKEKIAEINRIADAHSHGNAHHTQENFYISEIDLKKLSQNAIFVIETMDNLHKTCFVKAEN